MKEYADMKVKEALEKRPCPKCPKAADCPKPPPAEQLPCKPSEETPSPSRGGRGRHGKSTDCARDCPCSERTGCMEESECTARWGDGSQEHGCSAGARTNESEVWYVLLNM